MIEILGTILSRLVNVALFIIISIVALAFLREAMEVNLAVTALISIVIGVIGTVAVRYLIKLLTRVGELFS